jgi:hypothetical protein
MSRTCLICGRAATGDPIALFDDGGEEFGAAYCGLPLEDFRAALVELAAKGYTICDDHVGTRVLA